MPAGLLQRTQRLGGHAISTMRVFPASAGAPQAALQVSQPGDPYELEADRVSDQVMRMPEPLAVQPERLQRQVNSLEEEPEDEELQLKPAAITQAPGQPGVPAAEVTPPPASGHGLHPTDRAFMEPRFGHDFSKVRVHADNSAAAAAQLVNARAYTLGQDIVFGARQYAPGTAQGRRLLAHELTHVVQQGWAGPEHGLPPIQRTIGDGHDLASPRFSLLEDLEAAYDSEDSITVGDTGRGVQAIQQALYDLGFTLPDFGADGNYGSETTSAVSAFQTANPPLLVDGVVGKNTMTALDARFAAPVLPPAADLAATWVPACVLSVLCPWSPHTVDVLRTRIVLKSFDSISWADEEWDGAAWVPAPFPGGGFNTGTEIGILNDSCESVAEILYHEVLHAEQPTTHTTTSEKESYAYRIGEEFSIAMGLGGRPGLRSTDARGREFADPAKVGAFVASAYPSVPSGGGGDEIIGKAVTLGDVEVQRPDGTIYTRAAAVGEKVPGPMTTVNEVIHPPAMWTCP